MAKDKKSVLIYCDLIHTVEHLPDELAGRLFKHLLEYVNDRDPQTDDVMLKIAFEPIKQQLKRDLQKYNNIVERNRANGAKGGRPKNPNKPTGLSGNPKKPKKPDTDTDTDTDNDNVNDIVKEKETKEQRANKFALRVNAFLQYDKKMREEFISYWTESNEKGKKLRFELQKVFDIWRRLTTWNNRNKEKIPSKTKSPHDNIVTDGDYGVL